MPGDRLHWALQEGDREQVRGLGLEGRTQGMVMGRDQLRSSPSPGAKTPHEWGQAYASGPLLV